MIEYPLLAPELTDAHIAAGSKLAREWNIGCLVVRPIDADQAVRWMDGSGIPVGSVAGHPNGSSVTGTKLYEGRDLLRHGVREVDIVINVAKMFSRQFQYVEVELMQIAKSCLEDGAILKVDLRSDLLTDELKIIATKICKRIDARFMSIAGSESDFTVITPLLKDRIQLKVSTPVTSLEEALQMRARGATRMAATNIPQILTAWKAHLEARKQSSTPAT